MQAAAGRAGLLERVGARHHGARLLGAEAALQQPGGRRQRQARVGIVVATRVAPQQRGVERAGGGSGQGDGGVGRAVLDGSRRRRAEALHQVVERREALGLVALHIVPAAEDGRWPTAAASGPPAAPRRVRASGRGRRRRRPAGPAPATWRWRPRRGAARSRRALATARGRWRPAPPARPRRLAAPRRYAAPAPPRRSGRRGRRCPLATLANREPVLPGARSRGRRSGAASWGTLLGKSLESVGALS